MASLFRLGTVPGSPEEARAFLQARVRTYLGFMALLWSIAGILGTALAVQASPAQAFAGLNGLRTSGHLLGAGSLVLLFLATRRRRSVAMLAGIDLVATVSQGAFLGMMVVAALPIQHHDGLRNHDDLPRDGRRVIDLWS